MVPTRKSGRQRVPNKKYATDPLEGLYSANSDPENTAEPRLAEDNAEDADFSAEQAAAAEEVEANDEDDLIADNASDGSVILTPGESEVEQKPSKRKESHLSASYAKSRWRKKHADLSLHSRGVPETKSSEAKENYLKNLFGTGEEDLEHIVRSRDQWANEITLPRRRAENGEGGMRYSFTHTEEKREREAMVGWDWYYTRDGHSFAERQKTQILSDSEGDRYVTKPTKQSHSVLLGPYGKQKMFHLSHMHSLGLGEAWNAAMTDNTEAAKPTPKDRTGERAGWLLNVGTGVRCLDWAANHHGDTQYLAIATSKAESAKGRELHEVSPAFTPSSPSPSCVQIWAFSASYKSSLEGLIDTGIRPQLRLVICTEWGPVKYLKWCPMPRKLRDAESQRKISVGLLAGIWGDGYVRVVDVQMGRDSTATTSYVKYDEAPFSARPPKTLCTCLNWLSAADIAVGCANGFVSIYDISGQHPASPNPWFHLALHQTYVLAITSAYPSFPHLLATSSMDGYLRLTDLRAPTMDSVFTSRARVPPTTLAYCDAIFSIISYEENDQLCAYPLRRFFSSLTFARCPSVPLALAIGRVHPTAIAGCADGSLVAVNPMRRVLHRKEQQHQQTVWRHEWNRNLTGISRITEGYKVETTNMNMTAKKASEGMFVTIYEKESAVTQACWNPNLPCGGWVAVGMGSGLVRVEDLAI